MVLLKILIVLYFLIDLNKMLNNKELKNLFLSFSNYIVLDLIIFLYSYLILIVNLKVLLIVILILILLDNLLVVGMLLSYLILVLKLINKLKQIVNFNIKRLEKLMALLFIILKLNFLDGVVNLKD